MVIKRAIESMRGSSVRWWAALHRGTPGRRVPPVSKISVLMSDDELLQHAVELGRKLSAQRHAEFAPSLQDDLASSEATLRRTYRLASEANAQNRALEPAAVWLLDNFYLLEGHLREAHAGIDEWRHQRWPGSIGPDNDFAPRLLTLLRELVLRCDGRVTKPLLHKFISACQQGGWLSLAELWAVPLMLRLAVFEHLRPVASGVEVRLRDTAQAAALAERLRALAQAGPTELLRALALSQDQVEMDSSAWIAEFNRRIQPDGSGLRLVQVWLEQQLRGRQQSIETALLRQSRAQALAQVSASQCIASLRRIERTHWLEFVDAQSEVEAILRRDPAAVYAQMDATTRNQYRDAVAFLSAHSDTDECAVAQHVVALAAADAQSRDRQDHDRTHHVGYWLIGAGRPRTERDLRVRLSAREHIWRAVQRFPSWFYFVPIVAITLAGVLLALPQDASLRPAYAVLLAVLVAIAVSHLGVALVNWAATRDIAPRALARLDFSAGIPARWRTLVIVPCMLGNAAEVDELLRALEVRSMGNRDEELLFGLLTDFVDAPQRSMPDDGLLLARAVAGVQALNARRTAGHAARFFLFGRDRVRNDQDGFWMGWERKRGKLIALCRFLRGHPPDDFHLHVGDEAALRSIAFVITLDADTELPPDCARRLVATMAHPLNRPVRDARQHRIVAGYGVLQPRVSVGASPHGASRLARLFSEEIVLDPYTGIVSNSEQDLYGESSYIGKGIFDVDAFMWAAGARFPEQRVLSHDLLEGGFARTGFASDIELYERYPDSYRTDMSRRHRWTRGDWQIAAWLLPWVPGPRGQRVRNTLALHYRLKVLDNLRRSLVPMALLLILLQGWLIDTHPAAWMLLVSLVVFAPVVLMIGQRFLARNPRTPWRLHWRQSAGVARRMLAQAALPLVMLPFEAVHWLDAIARSIWRLTASRKNRLQWTPASAVAHSRSARLLDFYRDMAVAPLLALGTAALLWILDCRATTIWLASPVLVVWTAAPLIAWWLSQAAPVVMHAPLGVRDRDWLGTVACRTWSYFDAWVGEDTHALPPDNVQEYPRAAVAWRTSPTNIGMYLSSIQSARDFGYVTCAQAHTRVAATLDTLERLDRFRGHFLNWYDVRDLHPLPPAYVSTVDSGNFLASVLVLARGLEEVSRDRLFPGGIWRGLRDTWHVFREQVPDASRGRPLVERDMLATSSLLADQQVAGAAVAVQVRRLDTLTRQVHALDAALADRADRPDYEWLQRLCGLCDAWLHHARTRMPWLNMTCGGSMDSDVAALLDALDANPTCGDALPLMQRAAASLRALQTAGDSAFADALEAGASALLRERETAQSLADRCRALCDADYGFLLDPEQKLLAIGYDVTAAKRDEGTYDLLASEARLASFVAIAQGKLPLEHWLALGRRLTAAGDGAALVSWSGTLFEYLMPLLFTPAFDNTLLSRTCRNVVTEQIRYGVRQGIPWGISESAYNATDAHFAYQYRAFGVPGLGLKRGLAKDKVVAPYASMLALMLRPHAACRNLRALAGLGALGRFGFYEALDFTPARVPENERFALVRCFMAHHQGMSLLALSAVLNDAPMQRRFRREPMFRAHEILLQERVPATVHIDAGVLHAEELHAAAHQHVPVRRVIDRLDTPVPELQLLSNGRWHVFISQAGAGVSQWRDLVVNRWDQDGTRDSSGIFCYVQDLDSGLMWSNTAQPTGVTADRYSATFGQGNAEFLRIDGDIETRTRVAVSPEDDVELRRVTVINHSRAHRRIALTSYVEPALAQRFEALAHPAFDKLFMEIRFDPVAQALLATRRPRTAAEQPPTLFHLMSGRDLSRGAVSYETRRDVFVGRGGDLAHPAALRTGRPLAGGTDAAQDASLAASLDAMVGMRRELRLSPGEEQTVDLVTGVAPAHAGALALAARYADRHLSGRVLDLAWTHAQVLGFQLDVQASERQLFAQLASAALFIRADTRVGAAAADGAAVGQSVLWRHGISGDLPIVVARLSAESELPLAHQAIQMHRYWRWHGVAADLLFWLDGGAGYRQDLRDRVMALVTSAGDMQIDRHGGVFVRQGTQLEADDRAALLANACLVLDGRHGDLAHQLRARTAPALVGSRKALALTPTRESSSHHLSRPDGLQAFNGTGGWSADGGEYHIWLEPGVSTPMPWANVLANPNLGSVVTESGSATTWSGNAHEFRLTPWVNDPVTDASEEAFYVRDESSGQFWSPTPLPARGASTYLCSHGFGYSRFETIQADIASTLTTFVARDEGVKYSVLRLKNLSGRSRRLAVFGYVAWVLGEHRQRTAPHIVTHMGERVIWACNPFNDASSGVDGWFGLEATGVAVQQDGVSATGSRAEFIGRNRSLRRPRALELTQLGAAFGAAADPCGAWQVPLELAANAECELVFLLGAARDGEHAQALVHGRAAAAAELARVRTFWQEQLTRITVQTPDASMNRVMNGWLPYQVISSRLWGRSGYYQSGGAYGFRDQLQDTVSLLSLDPALAREQILRCAAHQFEAGDVLHWWHPPLGRGVRTRSSDDLLWLPWAVCEYVEATGDVALLDVESPFVQGRALEPGEASHYDVFETTRTTASLHEHCVRALDCSLRLGAHGLPLMGGGDWNDGMDGVGEQGRGESVWLAFFLAHVLRRYAALAARRGEREQAERFSAHARRLAQAIDAQAWDGHWYLRAYDDNGTALGAASGDECQIDLLPQSWAVLSDVVDRERQRQAVTAAMDRLVHEDDGVVQLFDPPFDKGPLQPGYIKGYLPGTRENGGQYTHAAVWLGMALARLGRHDDAWRLFDLINPASSAQTSAQVQKYRTEPYVVAADVYWNPAHRGRGGWTWYTGSAGWLYRFGLQCILGLQQRGDRLRIQPCMPSHWPSWEATWRLGQSRYEFSCTAVQSGSPAGAPAPEPVSVTLDGLAVTGNEIAFVDDGQVHRVEIRVRGAQT